MSRNAAEQNTHWPGARVLSIEKNMVDRRSRNYRNYGRCRVSQGKEMIKYAVGNRKDLVNTWMEIHGNCFGLSKETNLQLVQKYNNASYQCSVLGGKELRLMRCPHYLKPIAINKNVLKCCMNCLPVYILPFQYTQGKL